RARTRRQQPKTGVRADRRAARLSRGDPHPRPRLAPRRLRGSKEETAMSTPPKEPKPEDAARRAAGPALEHTFLGVAPAAPEAPSPAGSGGSAAGGSAIIAAPMISVSG